MPPTHCIILSKAFTKKTTLETQANTKMVKSEVPSRPVKAKSSFMIEDILRTTHVDQPCTTDRSSTCTADRYSSVSKQTTAKGKICSMMEKVD